MTNPGNCTVASLPLLTYFVSAMGENKCLLRNGLAATHKRGTKNKTDISKIEKLLWVSAACD